MSNITDVGDDTVSVPYSGGWLYIHKKDLAKWKQRGKTAKNIVNKVYKLQQEYGPTIIKAAGIALDVSKGDYARAFVKAARFRHTPVKAYKPYYSSRRRRPYRRYRYRRTFRRNRGYKRRRKWLPFHIWLRRQRRRRRRRY